ncbi:MAG TPA: ASKHA domain-containing protein [Anaerolineae bacterium]|nr:ASKHA domain-containing protein [Anaerolineae bacterium]HQK13787.1 ASKHA domain-containing protein [Anaerolineae bacterium]
MQRSTEQNVEPRIEVDLEPIGRRTTLAPGMTLLDAAQRAGVELIAVCGGVGACGKCRVRLMKGELTPPTAVEERTLSRAELAMGLRLACQARPLGNVKVDIPPTSLSTPQRLQVEGQESEVAVDPVVMPVDVTVVPPTLHDLRADTVRLTDALAAQGIPRPFFGQPVLRDLSEKLRAQNWAVRLALRRRNHGTEAVGVLHPDQALLGLAVDIGTTKMAAYLLDLATGHTLAKAGMMNPQIAFGEDVVSRIAYANHHPDGRQALQARLMESLNALLAQLCREAGVAQDQVVEAVVVGNTAIHHFFAGLPVRQLGESPYIAAASEALSLCACHLGLELASGAQVYLPPNIAGYVGADHVAMLLATEAWQAQRPTIALDIGTNTEISLVVEGRLLSCSCASGPAFEGAHIYAGMRAGPGAVEYVQIVGDEVRLQTIGGKPPVGICGSGILDAVAELRAAGIITATGRLQMNHPRAIPWEGGGAFLLAPASATGNGHDLLITRRDVNEIQLAKGAIRAGIEVLLQEAGLTAQDIDTFIVAGAFGTYLDLESAIRIGMFPPLPLERFKQVGNAAGTGARQMLISAARRRLATQIGERVRYVELTVHPGFTKAYMDAMYL